MKYNINFKEVELPQNNTVNRPSHYTYGSIECIDYIDGLGIGYEFCIGNAIKYLTRAGHKNNQIEDLNKAIWYIDHAKKSLGAEADE